MLVSSGLTTREALSAATVNPDEFYGRKHPATLVLLTANPLVDIRNTRRIETLIAGDRVWLRRDLDAMLANTKRRAIASK